MLFFQIHAISFNKMFLAAWCMVVGLEKAEA